MKSRRRWWSIYASCAGLVALALVWVTFTVLHLERAERAAHADAAHQEALRLALWRMDSWLAPLLAREAARPYFDYEPFYPQQTAYTRLLYPIEPGEVLTPSPLLSFRSEFFTLHFQIEPDGAVRSPQVPTGNLRDLAEDVYLPGPTIMSNARALQQIEGALPPQQLAQCVSDAEASNLAFDAGTVTELARKVTGVEQQQAQKLRSKQEFSSRRGAYRQSVEQNAVGEQLAQQASDPGLVTVGSLIPVWLGSTATLPERTLLFVRRVTIGGQEHYQGFVCNWTRLRDTLLEQIGDLFEAAELTALLDAPVDDETETRLATIPVALDVASAVPVTVAMITPARTTLALMWVAVVAGLIAVAVTLRASVAYGEKRSRFASAVTHELRTPLTTFQMYTEMLAEDMVPDEARRKAYLETLRSESSRLGALVENVLAYARLEEGGRAKQPQTLRVDDLVTRLLPPLEQRARDAGVTLELDRSAPDATTMTTDVDGVGQILFNLVDNACKYAGEQRVVKLHVSTENGHLRIGVRDYGPGIPARQAKAIFTAFNRGANGASDKPGIGLGLTLSRELAVSMGGSLALEDCPDGGSCFTLSVPM